MRITTTSILSILVLCGCQQTNSNYNQATCNDNFKISGNIFVGTQYTANMQFSDVDYDKAYKNTYSYILKNGYNINNADKNLGTIAASTNSASGKSVPYNAVVEKLDAGSKVSISYSTPAAVSSPDNLVRDDFCSLFTSIKKN
ncbi:hypothetical protein [uncultured Tolumonas sp.]|uniref:hypothetical protein n=1 Tax=uncultured Tolumonas sp. TaxID=263765 RepID=UPI002A0A19B8|nr:hypothetical protein [uncultured Tolumonas sp.]